MLLPTALPTATSGAPLRAELMLTASSGELVPKATTVSPTINGVIPAAVAMRAAPRTRISAPRISKAKPAISITTVMGLRSCCPLHHIAT